MGPVPKCLQQSDKVQFLHLFKTDNKRLKNYYQHVPHQTLAHRKSRQVRLLEFDKTKSETSPIVSSFRETGDKVTISEHQKSNKEDMLQKFPPKNILQKRFYSTDRDDGRLN